jgi:hypothetical protein
VVRSAWCSLAAVNNFQKSQHINNKHKKMKFIIKNLVMSGLILFAVVGVAFQGYSQPTVPAATPTVPQGKVISVYNSSGAYTNIPVPAE